MVSGNASALAFPLGHIGIGLAQCPHTPIYFVALWCYIRNNTYPAVIWFIDGTCFIYDIAYRYGAKLFPPEGNFAHQDQKFLVSPSLIDKIPGTDETFSEFIFMRGSGDVWQNVNQPVAKVVVRNI